MSHAPQQQRIQGIVSQFRNYDRCVYRWLESFPVSDSDKPIPVVFATPDRAFAAMNVLLKHRNQSDRDLPVKSIPLPFISVSSGRIQFDPDRYHGPVEQYLGATADNTVAYSVRHPLPYNITYRAEFWAKNQDVLNSYKYWVAASFIGGNGYENFLTVDLSDVWPGWSNKLVPITNEGLNFVGELEPDKDHRVLRMVSEFTLKGWVVPVIQQTKNIHKIIVDVYDAHIYADIHNVTGPEVEADPVTYEPIAHFEIEE